MPLTTFTASTPAKASEVNANFALCMLTDTAKTVGVTHTYSVTQTFTGGWTAGAACTISTGGLTITAGGLTVTAGGITIAAGKVTTVATSTANAGLRLPHGTAPTSPVDGDVWTTTAGLYVRVNGSTVGPLS